MTRLRRRPSPALVISLIALFVSLGGTSFAAATLINGKQIKRHSIATNRLTKKAIKQLKGNRGPAGPAGPAGATGAAGPAGSALAYAHINAGGTLDTAHSKNVSASSLISPGVYCVTVAVAVSNVTATVDAGNSGGNAGVASAILASQDPANFIGTLCPAGSNVIIYVVDGSGASADYPTWSAFN